jgi:hypothetical protein
MTEQQQDRQGREEREGSHEDENTSVILDLGIYYTGTKRETERSKKIERDAFCSLCSM